LFWCWRSHPLPLSARLNSCATLSGGQWRIFPRDFGWAHAAIRRAWAADLLGIVLGWVEVKLGNRNLGSRKLDSSIKIHNRDIGKLEKSIGNAVGEELTGLQKELLRVRNERDQKQREIEALEATPAESIADEDIPSAVVPAPGQVAAPAPGANVRRVPMIDPNGNPMLLREDQVPSALQAGWKQR